MWFANIMIFWALPGGLPLPNSGLSLHRCMDLSGWTAIAVGVQPATLRRRILRSCMANLRYGSSGATKGVRG